MKNEGMASILAENLKRARESASMSQRQVGILVGADSMQVSRWERGVSAPQIFTLYRLCRLFRVPMDILFVPEHPLLGRSAH